MTRRSQRRAALAVTLLLAAPAAAGCGGGDQQDAAPAPPPTPKAIDQARSGVQVYCTQVASYLAGRRGPPTSDEFDQVEGTLGRLADRAELSPEETISDGSTARLALGDLAENLEGTNCDSRLVELINERLAELPSE